MAVVTFFSCNRSDADASVLVHGKSCSHAKQYAKDPLGYDELDSIEADSMEEAFLEYNADFIDEGSSPWPIQFFPCTGLTKETVIVDDVEG